MSSGSGHGGGMPKRTGFTEGFYRSVYHTNDTGNANNTLAEADLAQKVVTALDVDSAKTLQAGTSKPVMERAVTETSVDPVTPPPAALRSPGELGAPVSASVEAKSVTSNRGVIENDRISSASRRRTINVIKSTMSPAAAAAAAASVASLHTPESSSLEPSVVCALSYRGMEVVFATVWADDCWSVVGVYARTRVAFQTLDIPKGSSGSNRSVISLTGDPTTGMVAVAMSDGVIQTYAPVETTPRPSSDPSAVVSVFGRFRWINGSVIHCADVFYQGVDKSTNVFQDICSGRMSGKSVHVSSSIDFKVLVAHRDQLAVFDGTPFEDVVPVVTVGEESEDATISTEPPHAALLWTTRMHANIVTAKLSGDGQAIVVVLEGEGVGSPDPFGARTYVRDLDDGSTLPIHAGPNTMPIPRRISEQTRQSSSGSVAVGIVYKPGPFLVHSTHVTRVSFRGLGHITSNVDADEAEGNDLLLTYCAEDCSARIFSQNSWKRLMHWTTPPNSRADWVRGVSAFTLGDLESSKKKKNPGSRSVSRRPSFGSGVGDESSGASVAISKGLLGSRAFQTVAANATAPSTAAGAWIAELTFRNAYPALRLSRLSYMKRSGDDMQPAHFESVAAILPAGSLIASSVLNTEDMGFAVQGIWPAWNPWLSGPSGTQASGSLSGSAMALLGLPSGSASATAAFGGSQLGGTHCPPSEVRLVASHPTSGNVVLMEFPLWGDQDFGAMELGSPLRYLLALSEDQGIRSNPGKSDTRAVAPTSDCIDHESSCLRARIDPGAKSLSITWRQPASMFVLPAHRHPSESSAHSIASTASVDSDESHRSFASHQSYSEGPESYIDVSLSPIPLALPKLRLPRNACSASDETIVAVKWWPDENFGGPPQVLAVTSTGTIILFEMPPSWNALEPAMPSYDPFDASTASSVAGGDAGFVLSGSRDLSDEDDSDSSLAPKDYEVKITPNPDFGIGLRLEAQADGMPAIAGSYKKHPLTGGRLPAERTGMIVLGDELLAINGVSLEGMSFDGIIATVREVGGGGAPDTPLCMRFRPKGTMRRKLSTGSAFSGGGGTGSHISQGHGRRTIGQMLGVSPKPKKKSASTEDDGSEESHVSMLVGAESEMQQEFSRISAIVRGGLHMNGAPPEADELQSRVLLLPWRYDVGAPDPERLRGAALFFTAYGNTLHAKRLEVAADGDPEKAQCYDLGTVELTDAEAKDAKSTKELQIKGAIQSVTEVKTGISDLCLVVYDKNCSITLVFVGITVNGSRGNAVDDDGVGESSSPPATSLRATFRQYRIFECGADLPEDRRILIRASSVELIATMPQGDDCRSITVWSACPRPSGKSEEDNELHDYVRTTLTVGSTDNQLTGSCVLDFRFVPSGCLDAFPWLVTFTQKSAIVHRRSGGSFIWKKIAELTFSVLDVSTHLPVLHSRTSYFERRKLNKLSAARYVSPADANPHLIPALRNIVSACDETKFLRSDWHPDSVLAYVCTENEGAKVALRRTVRGIYVWLSRWMSPDECNRPMSTGNYSLGVTPLPALMGDTLHDHGADDDNTNTVESASNLMSSFSLAASLNAPKPVSEEDKLLCELQKALCPGRTTSSDPQHKKNAGKRGRSKEFLLAMGISSKSQPLNGDSAKEAGLPPPLTTLNRDEIRLLWAVGEILAKPPKFKHLDAAAQLTLFCTSLLRHLSCAKNDSEMEDATAKKSSQDSANGSTRSRWNSHFKVQPQPEAGESRWNAAIASAGCVSAVASDCQGLLLQACRSPNNEKMDWPTARALRLPFWIRSDAELRRLSEEIGQRIYKDTRDIMECALFFVAVRNSRTLRNLAATDSSNTGRTFHKFISSHDFASQRGRKAAEKNAYSLLRKRRYGVAAAFFLLSEPPNVKTAIEIIVTQMEDLDLAFMVGRLVENAMDSSGATGALGFGGVMGGGGGFASGGISSPAISDESKFQDWKPNLGSATKSLIAERGIPLADCDSCLKALQLMWLGRIDEAFSCLSGLSTSPSEISASGQIDAIVPQLFDFPQRNTKVPVALRKSTGSANARVIAKANSLINFSSSPLLLKAMRAKTRERWASTLLVSRALSRRGIDLPSIRLVLENIDPLDLEEIEEEKEVVSSGPTNGKAQTQPNATSSSIFDAFDAPRPVKKESSPSEVMRSSVFDSFDAPPPRQKSTQKTNSAQMASSIFDGFDAPPSQKATQRKTSSAVASNPESCNASSSIFDSFECAPRQPKPPTATAKSQGPMSSSIFDAFDTQPPKTKSVVSSGQGQTGDMASSIFDTFDVPPKPGPPKPLAANSSEVPSPSAMGDSNANPHGTKTQQDPPQKSGESPDDPPFHSLPTPRLWLEWRHDILVLSVARRFLRDVARIVSRFHGDVVDAPMKLFRRHIHPLVPYSAAEILRNHCDGDALLGSIRRCLHELCETSNLEESEILGRSLSILACPSQPKRIIFVVLIYTIMNRSDLAEDVVRDASQTQMQMCEASAFSNDDLVFNRKTFCHIASQYERRQAARLSWQLELCLWLHRGGTYPLSVTAVKETIVSVRVGLFVASWGRYHDCLEKMVKCEPDCEMDNDAGHQLWCSMKMITSAEESTNKMGASTSGGWEFLVDCTRGDATDMLRTRPPGSFIIRPHSEDNGVFTLSFKTNLTPTTDATQEPTTTNAPNKPSASTEEDAAGRPPKTKNARPVKKDEVVQHAIVRLSDSGFRCGSFGPFSSLMKLLEAVSASLPFPLLFHEPPTERIIKDQGAQPSPNSLFFRKLALSSHSDSLRWNNATRETHSLTGQPDDRSTTGEESDQQDEVKRDSNDKSDFSRQKRFGMFSLLLALSEVRKQLSAVAAAEYEDLNETGKTTWENDTNPEVTGMPLRSFEEDSFGSISYATETFGVEAQYADASRILRPFLTWCRALEVASTLDLAPGINKETQVTANPVALTASETAIEVAPTDVGSCIDGGDAVIRQLIQPDSGVEFRTLRVGEGGDSAMLVLFSKNEAVHWFVSSDTEKTREDAIARLEMMEKRRVIEHVELDELATGHEVRYRFVDPWEVEALESKEAETMGASLGREHYYAFSVGRVARSSEFVQRSLGGLHLMALWSASKGGICLTKAIASVHPPWERDAGGDLQMAGGAVCEPSAFSNSIRQHLYRNALFRRMNLPQRFLALVQVELLDLKNLTSPGGGSSLSVYALLRLKRPGSGAPLTLKARTLDSACTQPTKISKSSGPNAPASWGSLVRFRFPLPEDVNCDGISFDGDREALFKGPPCVLQVSVYEKKFMKDIFLGGADVKMDALAGGGQLEEWVPLSLDKGAITWFARIRLTLRFELMCLESEEDGPEERPPSVGLRKIQRLSQMGGAHEDTKGVTKSVSTPDLLSYFESMVY